MKTFLAVLLVLSLGVSAVLFFREKEMAALLTALEEEKSILSQDLGELRADLEASKNQVGLALAKLENELQTAQEHVDLARENIGQRDLRIGQLESRSEVSETQVDELQIVLERLDEQIHEARRKLYTAGGDRELLMRQLHRLEAEKADLLKRWNDPKALRAQYAKVNEQSFIGQRIDWLRKGFAQIDDARGAERLLQRAASTVPSNHALVTEIDSTGTARVLVPEPAGGQH
jgi:chromosome segregation ATPase